MDRDIEAADGPSDVIVNMDKNINYLINVNKNVNYLNILTIGDQHIKINNFDIIEKLLVSILTFLDQHDVDLVVLLGDLMHDFEQSKIHQHMQAIRLLKTLASRKPTVCLIGNHDRHNPKVFLTNEHFFTGLDNINNLDIVDKGLIKTISKNGYRYRLMFVPYVPIGQFRKAVKIISSDSLDTIDLVFAHVEVKGVKIKADIISLDGDEWHETDPPLVSATFMNANILVMFIMLVHLIKLIEENRRQKV